MQRGGLGLVRDPDSSGTYNQRARLTLTTGHGKAEATELRPSLL